MQIRCYRCGWNVHIKKDEAQFALEALKESGQAHYNVRCPKCRNTNRVSVEQLVRIVPQEKKAE